MFFFSLESLEAPCGLKVRPRPVLHSLQPKLQKSHMHKSIPSVARVGKGMADRNDPRALNGSAFVQYLDGLLSSETTLKRRDLQGSIYGKQP